MKNLLAAIFLLITFAIGAQDIDYVKAQASLLSAPEMSGRGYVDKGVERAADFIAEEFQSIGLKPLSNDFRQAFEHKVNTFPKKVSLSIGGKTLSPGVDFLVAPDSPSIKGTFKALVIDEEELTNPDALFAGLQVCQDCIVVIDWTGREFQGSQATIVQHREMLRMQHPVIWISDDKLTWGVGHSQRPNALIEIIGENIKDGEEVKVKICAKEQEDFVSENVIGMIEGTVKPDSFVVFTAHYDHLGMMGKEATFYGANDNASGTAYIMSLAMHYVAHPPEYSCVFIAFAGEEAGLVGSKYFVDHPLIALDKIRFLINLDLMGSGIDGITVVNAPGVPSEFELMHSINEEKAYLPQIKSRKQTANSDHYYFSEQDVPAIFIYALGGSTAYHDIYDVSANLTFDEYEDIFKLLTDLVAKL